MSDREKKVGIRQKNGSQPNSNSSTVSTHLVVAAKNKELEKNALLVNISELRLVSIVIDDIKT